MALTIDKSLTLLINLSGKLRMLSHRIVMLGLLDIQNEAKEPQEPLVNAVNEFESIYSLMTKGDGGVRVGADTISYMKSNNTLKEEHLKIIDSFLALVHARSKANYNQDRFTHYSNMADMVGSELLNALNMINSDISDALEKRVQDKETKEANSANTISSVLVKLDETSKSVSLVATNAMIEAARAGDVGKGFAIIASEIKRLSDETSETVRELRANSR